MYRVVATVVPSPMHEVSAMRENDGPSMSDIQLAVVVVLQRMVHPWSNEMEKNLFEIYTHNLIRYFKRFDYFLMVYQFL